MHYRPRIKTALSPFALLLIILISQSLFGQVTSGTISGFVKDPKRRLCEGGVGNSREPHEWIDPYSHHVRQRRVRISGVSILEPTRSRWKRRASRKWRSPGSF